MPFRFASAFLRQQRLFFRFRLVLFGDPFVFLRFDFSESRPFGVFQSHGSFPVDPNGRHHRPDDNDADQREYEHPHALPQPPPSAQLLDQRGVLSLVGIQHGQAEIVVARAQRSFGTGDASLFQTARGAAVLGP